MSNQTAPRTVFFVMVEGQRRGPYGFDALQAEIEEGRIRLSDLGWCEGLPDWKPLRILLDETSRASEIPPLLIPAVEDVATRGDMSLETNVASEPNSLNNAVRPQALASERSEQIQAVTPKAATGDQHPTGSESTAGNGFFQRAILLLSTDINKIAPFRVDALSVGVFIACLVLYWCLFWPSKLTETELSRAPMDGQTQLEAMSRATWGPPSRESFRTESEYQKAVQQWNKSGEELGSRQIRAKEEYADELSKSKMRWFLRGLIIAVLFAGLLARAAQIIAFLFRGNPIKIISPR